MMTKTKIEGKFYPLTADIARTLREANLTAAEGRLWSYLIELDQRGAQLPLLENLKRATAFRRVLYLNQQIRR